MNVSRQRLNMFQRRRWKNAVAQIEDVAGTSAGALEDFVGRGEHAIEWTEQQRRVEVALNRAVRSDALPRLVQRRAPVGANHVAAGRAQLAENRSGADAEMNRRNAAAAVGATGGVHPIEDPLRVRQDELAV